MLASHFRMRDLGIYIVIGRPFLFLFDWKCLKIPPHMIKPLGEPFPSHYCSGVDVRGDRQAECGGPGEVRQADRANTQRRHTVYATLDQLSLQLCLHSGIINTTAEAGSHTHLSTHTGRCNNLWPHLHTCFADLSALCPTLESKIYWFLEVGNMCCSHCLNDTLMSFRLCPCI